MGLHHLWAQPSAPCDLLHSGKELEVIHSGNCDCLFPGRGCSWEVPAAFPQGSRAHCLSLPGCPGSGRIGQRKSQVRPAACRGQPSTCRHRRAPRSSAAPRPLLFVTARLPVCGRRPGLTSRAGKPPKAANFSETLPLSPASCLLRISSPSPPPPRPGTRAGREPREAGFSSRRHGWTAGWSRGTRGRCAAAQAAVPLEAPGAAPGQSGDPVQES